ncbi:MAG: ribonuclease HII [Lachnospiraceae bacterium]|nr:ribonuclease HII [Lachnospiraceae bacterium]
MKQIKEIREEFAQAAESELSLLFEKYEDDSRSGVRGLVVQYRKKLERLAAERKRLENMRIYEHKYEELGLVCGIDEAGRGPLAGPVVAGAVILPVDCEILYLNDSKKLSPARREELFDEIQEKAVAYGIGMASPARIDEINILQATYEAMREAISKLNPQPEILLNDAVTIPEVSCRQVPIIGGDGKSLSIAAASVLAKVTRDRLMMEYDRMMPQYGFATHKGYGTAAHIEALKQYGPSPIHRKTFIGHFLE